VKVTAFVDRQIRQLRSEGYAALLRKIKMIFRIILNAVFVIPAIPIVIVIRLVRPWFLVRIFPLFSQRIGHFAANTELYLCERDAGINLPACRHADIFYFAYEPICNLYLARMWKRVLSIWPALIIAPIVRVNRLIPGGSVHEGGHNTQHDRDVHNLLDRFPPHLAFTDEEIARGEAGLMAMGISPGSSFVCLTVRDSAYLDAHLKGGDYTYHNYRDSNVENYVLAAEELADRGFFVLRMGVKVHEAIKSNHPKVIDYAMNGMRTDFMDVYLGAMCAFCISVGTGFDAIPLIFRRPIAYVNMVPVGYFFSFRSQFLGLFKHHISISLHREMTLSEIIDFGVGFSMSTTDYETKGVQLIENTPEEIQALVIEMVERLDNTWKPEADDEMFQQRFWEIFPSNAVDPIEGKPLHGEIRARYGACFLRSNLSWLQ